MASKMFGIVKAPIRQSNGAMKYIAVGRAVKDDQGRIAIIIESLPRDMTAWTGWLNIYEDEAAVPKHKPSMDGFDDDIPF